MSQKLGNIKKNLYTNTEEARETNDQLQQQCRWKMIITCQREQTKWSRQEMTGSILAEGRG